VRAIVALCAALLAAATLGACGSGAPSATALLDATFRAHAPIPSGQLELSLSLTPPPGAGSGGGAADAQPLHLRLAGPFRSAGPGRLPSFALTMSLATGGRTLHAGASAAGGRLYVELAGVWFSAPPSTLRALTQGYAGSGIDPSRWLAHPVVVGAATVAGTATTHIRAGLDAPRFLADVRTLAGAGLLSPSQLTALAAAARAARVDLYTASADHRLRRLAVSGPGLAIELRFSDLGRPQPILAPAHPRPLSELVSQLRGLGVGG
jgi:hypothetical protein